MGGVDEQAVAWLRQQIKADRAAATEAADGDSGNWFMGDKWNVYRAEDENRYDLDCPDEQNALVCWGNVKPQSEHIAIHDPRDVLARCDADLAIVDLCARVIREDEGQEYWSDGWAGLGVARVVLGGIAAAYRHRPGYGDHWPAAAGSAAGPVSPSGP